jgi:hypothetical protein
VSATAAGWTLKFLGGAMRGRSVVLKSGDNVLGSASGADVLLPPADGVLARHAVLAVGEVALAVQRVDDAELRVNGVAMQTQRRSLIGGDILSIGALDLELDRPMVRAVTADETADGEDRLFAPAGAGVPPVAPTPAGLPRGVRIGAGAACVLGVAALLFALARVASAPAAGESRADLATVQRAVGDFHEVEVSAVRNGTLAVKGFVESRERKAALQSALAPFGPAVGVSVHAADDLVEQARRYIDEPGVSVRYAGGGKLVASGTADDDAVRQRVKRLADDLYPSVALSDTIEIVSKAAPAGADPRDQWAQWQNVMPARIVSITTDADGRRHIQLANGARYYEGSVLRSGAELQRIAPDALVIDQRAPAQ